MTGETSAPEPSIHVASTRGLLTAAFELLSRSSEDMRRASFYVGSVVLGTAGPLVLAFWAIGVYSIERLPTEVDAALGGTGGAWLSILVVLAVIGLIVAAVESRNTAIALLGARYAGRPIAPRQALARSRRVFWSAVVAAVIVAVPLGIAQGIVDGIVAPLLGEATEISVITTTLVTALVGAPFAYTLSGIVLGDVGPVEAVRRSFRVFSARRSSAVVVVIFETVAILLVFLGLTTGLDIGLRILDALGLGLESGPIGLAVMTALIVAGVFAFGTLLFTVIALTIAPQVVMFVGLTHATMGLDHVSGGGRDDPEAASPARRRMRTFSAMMLGGFAVGALALAATLASFPG